MNLAGSLQQQSCFLHLKKKKKVVKLLQRTLRYLQRIKIQSILSDDGACIEFQRLI